MITSEINKCLETVSSFNGTYACNRIPKANILPASFVVNTAPLTAADNHTPKTVVEGKHWIVLILHISGKAEYFDSFGIGPTQPHIAAYIAKHSTSLKFNNRLLQDPFSKTCGVWCIDYIIQRMRQNVSMRAYITSFLSAPDISDRQVVDRVTCGLSARQRLLASKVKNCLS